MPAPGRPLDPEEVYERHGDVGNVVFPCGYTIEPDGDTINMYYGAAYTCLALARGSIKGLLEWIRRCGRPDVGGTGARGVR